MSYFTVQEIAPAVFHIHEPAGVYFTLIIGNDRALLYDTGYGFADVCTFVKSLTKLPLTVMCSHCHLDHAGGNYLFDQKIYIHPYEKTVYDIYQGEKESLMDRLWSLHQSGKNPRPWPEGFDREKYLPYKPFSSLPLEDGQTFDLGDRLVKVIFVPGHTKGGVCLYDFKTGLLLAGDAISHSNWIMFDQSAPLSEYRKALRCVQENYKLSGVVGSHYGNIYPPTIIDSIINCIDNRNDGTSTVFIHPRKGYKARRYKTALSGVPGIQKLYLVFPLDEDMD